MEGETQRIPWQWGRDLIIIYPDMRTEIRRGVRNDSTFPDGTDGYTLRCLARNDHHSDELNFDVYHLDEWEADPWIKRFVFMENKFRRAGKSPKK